MSMSFPFWIWEEISNARKLIAIHTRAKMPVHRSTRRHRGRAVTGLRGGFSSPSPPASLRPFFSRTFDRSGERSLLKRPGRDL